MKFNISDRWKFSALPGLLMHSCLGTVYCWSLLANPVKDSVGISCEWAFSLAIFFLGLTAAISGPFIERNIRLASLISALCFGTGMIVSGIACITTSPILFHIGYGVIMGIGLGIGYIIPIKAILIWFKEKKGLVIGISIAGFGLAKILGGPGFSYFIRNFGITETLIFHGFLYMLLMLLSVAFIRLPENTKIEKLNLSQWFTDLVKTLKYENILNYWLICYLGVSAGLAIISNEVIFFNYSGITSFGIGFAVSLCAITNTLGRVSIAWLSDLLKNQDILISMITIICILSCLIGFTSPGAVSWVVLICNAGYGALFVILPCALASRYGLENIGKTSGVVLSSWALAGLTGNQIANLALWLPNSYSPRVIIFCAIIFYVIATSISTKLWKK